MKKIIKYIYIYVITVIICITALVETAKIPKSSIEQSIKESVEYYKRVDGIERIIKDKEYSYLHYYADSILLNIIYCIDTNKPLESVMISKYYQEIYADVNYDFIQLVEESKEPNQQYLRYWHGSMSIIRPMLTVFNIEQIYIINTIIIFALIIFLMFILIKKYKPLALAFLIGLVMITIQFVPACLEYSWTIIIMLIASIIGIIIEKDKPNWLGPLFMITGMLTCFLDFLSTEILTVFIPLLLILVIQNKEERLNNLKDAMKFTIRLIFLWGIGYVGMWLTKWGLASIILKINVMDYVTQQAIIRIGLDFKEFSAINFFIGETKEKLNLTRLNVIIKNIQNLLPFAYFGKNINIILLSILAMFLIIEIIIVDRKKIKKMWFSIVLLTIGIMPYIRYELLLNHSYKHRFFTFRNQLITIICLTMIIIDSYKARKKWIVNLEEKIKETRRKI